MVVSEWVACFGRGEESEERMQAKPSLFLSTSGPIMLLLTPKMSAVLHQSVTSRLPCLALSRRVRVCPYLVVLVPVQQYDNLFSLFSPMALSHFYPGVLCLVAPAITQLSGEGLSHYNTITHSFHPTASQLVRLPSPSCSPSPPSFAPLPFIFLQCLPSPTVSIPCLMWAQIPPLHPSTTPYLPLPFLTPISHCLPHQRQVQRNEHKRTGDGDGGRAGARVGRWRPKSWR